MGRRARTRQPSTESDGADRVTAESQQVLVQLSAHGWAYIQTENVRLTLHICCPCHYVSADVALATKMSL